MICIIVVSRCTSRGQDGPVNQHLLVFLLFFDSRVFRPRRMVSAGPTQGTVMHCRKRREGFQSVSQGDPLPQNKYRNPIHDDGPFLGYLMETSLRLHGAERRYRHVVYHMNLEPHSRLEGTRCQTFGIWGV